MLKNAHLEVDDRLAKWIIRNIEKRAAFDARGDYWYLAGTALSIYDPPTMLLR